MRSCVWQWTCKSGFLICCILFRPTMVHNFLNITNRFLSCQRTGATYCCMTHKEFRPELNQLLCCWLYRVGLGFLKMAYCILPYAGAQWRTPKWHRIGNWYFKSILLQNTDNLKILAFRWRIGGLLFGPHMKKRHTFFVIHCRCIGTEKPKLLTGTIPWEKLLLYWIPYARSCIL